MLYAARVLVSLAILVIGRVCAAQIPDTTDSAKPDIETTLETLGDHARDDYANLEQLAEALSDARGGEGRGFQMDFLQRMTRRLDLGRAYDSDTTRTTYRGGPSRIYTRLTASYGRHIAMRFAA